MLFTKKNKRRDLREVYRAAEQIQTAENPRDVDLLTGYAIGLIDEKRKNGKLTKTTADAIAEMVGAVGEDVFRGLMRERRERERENEQETERAEIIIPPLIDFMAEM